jgi:hypothetical protein
MQPSTREPRTGLAHLTAQWGPTWIWLLLDLALAAIASSVVTFFVILPLKEPLDGFAFQARSNYQVVTDVSTGGPHSPDTVITVDGVPLAPISAVSGPVLDSNRITTVELVVVRDMNWYVAHVLGSNVGQMPASGALLDHESALKLGVERGDKVVVALSLLADSVSPTVEIGGLVPPYVSVSASHATGLLVVESRTLPSAAADFIANPTGLAAGHGHALEYDAGLTVGKTRTSEMGHFLLTLLSEDRIVANAGVVLFAVLLWLTIAFRIGQQALQRIAGRS